MNVLITGGAGCLGRYLLKSVPTGVNAVATVFRRNIDHPGAVPVDLRDRLSVNEAVKGARPDMIIHTAYDQRDLDGGIVQATANILEAAKSVGAGLVFLSSDLVLDGEGAPYDESAPVRPIMPYGKAKATAELYVAEHLPDSSIIRTSLILGSDPVNPSSQWIIDSLSRKQKINLFVDELRCPILADDLARMIWDIVALDPHQRGGVWNLVGPEVLSRFTIGLLLARRFGGDPELIQPARLVDCDTPRPRDLRMSTYRADQMLPTKARPVSCMLINL